jgi:hypothetical protein
MVVWGTALVLGWDDKKREALNRGTQRGRKRCRRIRSVPLQWNALANGIVVPFPSWYIERVEKMIEFTLAVTKPGGWVVQIGDNDSGRFVKLRPGPLAGGEPSLDHRGLVAAGAGLFDRRDWRRAGSAAIESWAITALTAGQRLPGSKPTPVEGLHAQAASPVTGGGCGSPSMAPLVAGLTRRGFPHFGLYVYRSPRLFLSIRCGGSGQIPGRGHGHRDQLAIELTIDGTDLIRDPGSYVYTPCPALRDLYRSRAVHFVPQRGDMSEEPFLAGLWQLTGAPPAVCIEFGEHRFVGAIREQAVCRTVEIGEHTVRVTDRWDDGMVACIELGPGLPPPSLQRVAFSPGYGQLSAVFNIGDAPPDVAAADERSCASNRAQMPRGSRSLWSAA